VALIVLIVAAAVAIAVTPLWAALATRWGVVDRPGPLKVQQKPVPYLGGLAVMTAVAAAGGHEAGWWLLAPALVCGLGLVDDLRALHPLVRIVGEAVAGAACGAVVGHGTPGHVVLGAVLMVALTNTVNLLDGLDAVAAATTAMCALGLAALGSDRIRTVGLALVGALLGFMVYNRPPARIYLGDSGSYLIGGVLTTLILGLWADTATRTSALIVIPLVISVPVADTTIAIIRRLRSHQPLWAGDRSHIYDQLVARGLSVQATATTCAAVQGVLVLVAYAAAQGSEAIALVVAGTGLAALAAILVVFGFTRPAGEMPA
jgi:UDP-N-acetylmuramyl pentapeptide phosphotransferase/UDP-N-acetylglucosamine-1-phosphate transferase